MRSKYVATNAADHIELPSKPQSKEIALTHDQVHHLAEETARRENAVRYRSDTTAPQTSPAALATMVRFLAHSGLRYGECAALRVGDADTATRRVVVGKSITQVRGQGLIEGDTKTYARRAVPILTNALAEELRVLAGDRNPREYLFRGRDGGPMAIGWFRVRFNRAVAQIGAAGFTPHVAALRRITGAAVRGLSGHRAEAPRPPQRHHDVERLFAHVARRL